MYKKKWNGTARNNIHKIRGEKFLIMFISRQDTADETVIIIENSLTVIVGNKQIKRGQGITEL